jgi:hypothetical protein
MCYKVTIVAGIPFLIVGGALVGNYESESGMATGAKLVQAGYIIFAAILAFIIASQAYVWRSKSKLTGSKWP